MATTFNRAGFRQELERELTEHILPFWMTHVVDEVNGGFHGAVTNDLQVHHEVPRSAIMCARILWTYAAAFRILGDERYLEMAYHAYDYLTDVFWDDEHGGVYWDVDHRGTPVSDRKHHYAQAFAIYGLTEYYRMTREPHSLTLARALFHLMEKHAHDAAYQGYFESSSREWEALEDVRLSDRDLNCPKSMNTMLHILEAYTNLLQVWDGAYLKARHRALLEAFQRHIIDYRTGHFRLFFDEQWHSLSENVSYGHDIEGSWLLVDAAQAQGNSGWVAQMSETAVLLATAVYEEGLAEDGSIPYESGPDGLVDAGRAWWVQAEAMVGFYNAHQLTGEEHFAEAAYRCWSYIQSHVVDRAHGEWFKRLHPDGTPDHTNYKAGPWEDPYHHGRACFEMLDRLAA